MNESELKEIIIAELAPYLAPLWNCRRGDLRRCVHLPSRSRVPTGWPNQPTVRSWDSSRVVAVNVSLFLT